MGEWDLLAEKKIDEAIREGLFDALPGFGKPLPEDRFENAPAELRPALRLLDQAGVLPQELALKMEIRRIEDALSAGLEGDDREALGQELSLLNMRYESLMSRHRSNPAARRYSDSLRRRLGGARY